MFSRILLCLLVALAPLHATRTSTGVPFPVSAAKLSASDRILAQAFKKRTSGFFIKLQATVILKLPDDNEGSRHQRFIVRLASGQTLLIAHNIDLAPKIKKLRVGDKVVVRGEYIWNDKGGLIHWTHHDPKGKGPEGWIRHKGRKYR